MKQDEASMVIYFPTWIPTIKIQLVRCWMILTPLPRKVSVKVEKICAEVANSSNRTNETIQVSQTNQSNQSNQSNQTSDPGQIATWLMRANQSGAISKPDILMTWYTDEANYKASCPTLVKLHGACVGCLRHLPKMVLWQGDFELIFWIAMAAKCCSALPVLRIMTSQWMTRPCLHRRWCGLFAQMNVKCW